MGQESSKQPPPEGTQGSREVTRKQPKTAKSPKPRSSKKRDAAWRRHRDSFLKRTWKLKLSNHSPRNKSETPPETISEVRPPPKTEIRSILRPPPPKSNYNKVTKNDKPKPQEDVKTEVKSEPKTDTKTDGKSGDVKTDRTDSNYDYEAEKTCVMSLPTDPVEPKPVEEKVPKKEVQQKILRTSKSRSKVREKEPPVKNEAPKKSTELVVEPEKIPVKKKSVIDESTQFEKVNMARPAIARFKARKKRGSKTSQTSSDTLNGEYDQEEYSGIEESEMTTAKEREEQKEENED